MTPDARYALTAGIDVPALVWDIASGGYVKGLHGLDKGVRALCSLPGTTLVAGGHKSGAIVVWDLPTGRIVQRMQVSDAEVVCLQPLPDGRHIISGSGLATWKSGTEYDEFRNWSVRLWDVTTGRCRQLLQCQPNDGVYELAVSPDGRFVLRSGYTNPLCLLEVASNDARQLLDPRGTDAPSALSMAIAPDCKKALVASCDGVWQIELPSGRRSQIHTGHEHPGASVVRLDLGGHVAFSGGFDRTVRIWDPASGETTHTLRLHTDDVTLLDVTQDGHYLISGALGGGGQFAIWELEWEHYFPATSDWDERARVICGNFLRQHSAPPPKRAPFWVRHKTARPLVPVWTEAEFQQLLYTLGCAGYGWLRPEGVKRELENMARGWDGPPPLFADNHGEKGG